MPRVTGDEVLVALRHGGRHVPNVEGSHTIGFVTPTGPATSRFRSTPVGPSPPGNLQKAPDRANMTVDRLRELPYPEESAVRFTTLLLPDQEPDAYVAFVPALNVVTQGVGVGDEGVRRLRGRNARHPGHARGR